MTNKRLLHFLFIINIILMLSGYCFAQSITWQKVYGRPGFNEDICNEICKADGNNFYAAGHGVLPDSSLYRPFILKVNEFGDTLWSRFIHIGITAFAICPTTDGGCVVTGDADFAFAVRLNKNGDIVWQKNYGGEQIQCYDILNTSDGGFLLCGTDLNTNWDGYALKIDSLGNSEWQKLYPAILSKDLFAVQEAYDGGYIFTGRINNGLQNEIISVYLLKTDIFGNQIWDRRYFIDSLTTSGHSLLKVNNNYLISGANGDPGHGIRICFLKTDINGNLFFSKIINTGSIRKEYYYYTAIKSPNRYIFCFERDTAFQSVAGAVITDSIGNVINSKILNYPNAFRYAAATSAITYPNGDIVFGGISAFPGTSNDFYLVRTDSNLYSPPYIGINNYNEIIPVNFEILSIYPNPFNPATNIKYSIPQAGLIKIIIYDINGKNVETIFIGNVQAGNNEIIWHAKNLSSGVYFISINFRENIQTKKVVYLK